VAQQTIARVWDITLTSITAEPLATEVLQVLACLAPDTVPRSVLAALDDEPTVVDTLGHRMR
jgi:hypothetical protein